jgi:hypothetical protein
VNVKIEILDIIALIVLISLIFVAFLFLTPTSITQSTNATSLVQTTGSFATYYVNLTAANGYRAIPLSVSDIRFTGGDGWNYTISHSRFVLYSGSSYSEKITVFVPPNASIGSNTTLSLTLSSYTSPGAYSQSMSFRTIAASKPFVQSAGQITTVDVLGLNLIPWYAVIGPLAVVVVSVGSGIIVSYSIGSDSGKR